MLNLENVTETIEVLQEYAASPEMDINILLQKIKDFFFLLVQEDQFYIVAADPECSDSRIASKSFLPYIATVNDQNSSEYLRLFSHKEAALKFSQEHELPEHCCVKITAMDAIQMAKYWFMRGVSGFILNDSSSWIVISFPDFLCSVFTDLLCRPEMFNEEFVSLIQLLSKLDHNQIFYKAISDSNPSEDTLYIVSSKEKAEFHYEPVAYSYFETLPDEINLIIVDEDNQFQTSGCMVHKALAEFQRNASWNTNFLDEFPFKNSSYINLDFNTEEGFSDSFVMTEPESSQESLSEPKPSIKNRLQNILHRFRKAEQEDNSDQDEKVSEQEKPVVFDDPALIENQNADSDFSGLMLGQDDPAPICSSQHKKNVWSLLKSVKLAYKITAVVLIFSVILVPFGFMIRHQKTVKEFRTCLDSGKYTEALQIYQDHQNSKHFVKTIQIDLENLIIKTVDQYAADQYTAEETYNSLSSFYVFPGLSELIQEQMIRAKELEKSKNAFLHGTEYIEKGNYLQGLNEWTAVIEADSSFRIIQDLILKKSDEYKVHGLVQCLDYKKENQLEQYRKGIELLHWWFPDDDQIREEFRLVSAENPDLIPGAEASLNPFSEDTEKSEISSPSNYPIQFRKLKVGLPNHAGQGGRDLYIVFTNISGKDIKRISFLVEAVDGIGKPMTCARGGYSQYLATVDQPVLNGETFGEDMSWPSAWHNSMIDHVKLCAVTIEYEDGTTQAMNQEQSEKLEQMLHLTDS